MYKIIKGPKMKYGIILIQIINILLNTFETGTQDSIDGYFISLIFGIFLCILLIIVQIFYKDKFWKNSIFGYIILIIPNIFLYFTNYRFIYYVTYLDYSINDVIIEAVDTGLANYSNNKVESLYPVIFYLLITINIIICIINIAKRNNKNGL